MNLSFELLPWQKTVFQDKTRFKVIVAGRRCGKSRLSAVALLVEGLKCPQGSAVMYVAPTQGQARQIIWDLLMELGRDVIQSSHVNNMDITLINGAKIYVRGSDRPDTLRGVSLTFLVLDEVADIKADTWEKVLRAALSDKKGNALFIGTPKGRNWFYDMYNLGLDGSDEEWKSWHFTTKDNPLIDPKEVDAAKKTLSSFSFKQEYEASFDNAGTDLFKEKWIRFGEEPSDGVWYLAIDLAGFTNTNYSETRKKRLDESAIAVVKVTDDGVWFVKKIEHGRWDVKDAASRILKNIQEFEPVGVGMERGTVRNAVLPYLSDLMRSKNTYATIHDLTHGGKQKTERVVWALQGRFEHGKVILNEDEDWKEFQDQLLMFPTSQVHDDLVDALSYVDQLAVTSYFTDDEDDEYECLDFVSGY
jgi:phage terminase large subunit-like protein